MGKRVSRFDFHRIDAARVRTTPQGFLTVGGRLTRVGVLDYYRQDGSVYRELRLPEEVFRADSLGTLAGAPVTDLHGGMVSPDNIQALGVGLVGPDVAGGNDGAFVTGSATIQRADTIKAVQDRSRRELSPGYECWVQDEGGVWDGSAYGLGRALKFDGTQRDIIYNHLAVGPKDWGRSGPDVALRMDGLAKMGAFARCDTVHGSTNLGGFLRDQLNLTGRTEVEITAALQMDRFELGMILDGFMVPDRAMLEKFSGLIEVPVDQLEGMIPESEKGEAPINPRPRQDDVPAVTARGNVPMKKMIIVVDGMQFEVEVPESLAPTLEAALTKQRTDAAALPKVQGELAVANKELGEVKGRLDAALDPIAIQAHINARTSLVTDAAKLAPELKIDAAHDGRAVKIAALVANGFAADMFTEKTDSALIDGMFIAAVAKADAAPPAGPALRVAPGPSMRTDNTDKPKTADELKTPASADECTTEHADAARRRMMARGRDASSQPISNSMTREDAQRR